MKKTRGRKKIYPEREKEIFEYIVEYKKINKYSPTVREIGAYMKILSVSLILFYLDNLEKKDFIKRNKNKYRTIITLKNGWNDD